MCACLHLFVLHVHLWVFPARTVRARDVLDTAFCKAEKMHFRGKLKCLLLLVCMLSVCCGNSKICLITDLVDVKSVFVCFLL